MRLLAMPPTASRPISCVLCFLGPWTKKAFETPRSSIVMDARQTERHLRAELQPFYAVLKLKYRSQAPRPSPGPHKLRESLPLTIFLRNRLKYALTGREVITIVNQRLIKVDGKVRTDPTYPTGFMGKQFQPFHHWSNAFISRQIPSRSKSPANIFVCCMT